ncbi:MULTISPECIES: 3-phosphoserine/phosphohydroxythreonine transaminase [unclassified Mucilaginibacter]|uniref:3-phosphoserine/phosphohydroxythreonine transaminase n=1 Tax=unclassified Mucilaginibacter TaxID=2617802 RepID=UPI00095F2139|nr:MULTISPECIES: 3-phosphoserine/phosphohydroxythreonine transaminase [unclassified Mucilaginibacter]HEK19263.1 3-phosphoserine/phosphohydroxythreonine transaminase [Bacteroidota bacterium]OJW18450.1 MAG: phosphoserine transaminase [Mucilaginibacter sp. 44-25]PLW89888.1 MAG: 3-phosphoserine/phosphohydroxythreonine transaminase [Mucilaginibacter sp.]PMP65592.1 MAG: 3-phosphoserine/phosphohydroxythreonine transaminase [Mucilaginibacter sp.]PMP65894.1 MAG: 3-phosphoserine/phosphohydroxythreonine 
MKYNFGAGPGILPQEVFKQAAAAVLDFNGTGLSLLEISHRSPEFEEVLNEAVALVKELFNVPEGYSVLFLQGGASTQFAMAPNNLLPEGGKAAYLDTGVWASKALKEAKFFGDVEVVASSKESNYTYIPKDYTIPTDAAYFHITSNNTIYGTQLQQFPKSPVPLVCDMSSDIFSRYVNVADFGLIYAGAQKNMGPAGVTLVIVKDDILGKTSRKIPAMYNYQVQIEGGSMYNTPPCFAIYVSMLTLKWLKSKGGVPAIEKENNEKARVLYEEIDRNPLFKAVAAPEDRSRMNVCFVMENAELEKPFLKFCDEKGIVGIKGHRSVGGFRASIYNALPITSVYVLIDAMREFAEKNK